MTNYQLLNKYRKQSSIPKKNEKQFYNSINVKT